MVFVDLMVSQTTLGLWVKLKAQILDCSRRLLLGSDGEEGLVISRKDILGGFVYIS